MASPPIRRCGSVLLALPALAAGCVGVEADTPASAGRIAIEVAPLSLAGVTDASYTVVVTNAPDGGGEVVWERTGLTSRQFGDGAGSLSYVGPCDAATGINSVTVTLLALYEGDGVPLAADSYENPGALTRDVQCLENTDVSVAFDITMARDAQQGFFDVAVNFDDIFCSAKLDCLKSGTSDDLELLFNPATGARDLTAVLGFACTAGPSGDTFLYLDDPVISCTGTGPFASQDVTFDSGVVGNVDLGASTTTNPGGYLFAAAVYLGNEQLASKAYWNLSFGLDADAFAQAQSCSLTTRATASATELASTAEGFVLPPNEVYPVITWNVPLTDGGGRVCTTHAVNGGNEVVTRYVGYLAGSNQFTWSPGPTPWPHQYSARTRRVTSADGAACRTGADCVSGTCSGGVCATGCGLLEGGCPAGFTCSADGFCEGASVAGDDVVYVPSGTFYMGCNAQENGLGLGNQCYSDEVPQRLVTLSAYAIDRTEVAWEDYAAWCSPPRTRSSSRPARTTPASRLG